MFQKNAIALVLLSGIIITTTALAQDSGKDKKDAPRSDDIRERMRERRDEIRGTDEKAKDENGPTVTANQPSRQNGNEAKTTEDGPEPSRRVKAEDILNRLRRNRRTEQTILPVRPGINRVERTDASPRAIPNNAIAPINRKLRPDGSRIVDRAGRLTRSGDFVTFTFESRGDGQQELPLRLLPNRLLEDMELISENGRKSITFVVSGHVTEYKGVNYLLVEKLLQRADLGNFR